MRIKLNIVISIFFIVQIVVAQSVTGIYKINDLLKRIENESDTIYVVNFWATWCKPCVQELPDFELFSKAHQKDKIKVLLVSLNFSDEITKKVNPFLVKNGIVSECVLLDEVNGNDYINKISSDWTGAIPATLFLSKNRKTTVFKEKKLGQDSLNAILKDPFGLR